jgi:hypothetical protein
MNQPRYNRKGKLIPSQVPATPVAAAVGPLSARGLEEQLAAQNLVQLSGQGNSGIGTLVDALLSAAEPGVISLMAQGNVDHIRRGLLSQMDKQSLRAMLANAEELAGALHQLIASDGGEQGVVDGPRIPDL